jgi:hypothetical protein
MISPIPYQPINFEPLTGCQSGCDDSALDNGCGGSSPNGYQTKVYPTDSFQFQFNISICDDAAQLLLNNDFATNLDNWTDLSGNVTAISGAAVFGGDDTLQQSISLTLNKEYFIQIEVTSVIDGDLIVSLGANINSNFSITESGVHQIYLTASSASNFKLIYEGSGCTIGFVNLFEAPDENSFEVEVLDGSNLVVAVTGPENHNVSGGIATVSFTWNQLSLGYAYSEPLPDGCYTLRVAEICEEAETMTSNTFCVGSHAGTCLLQFRACMDSTEAFGLNFTDFAPTVRVEAIKGFGKHQWDRVIHKNSAGRRTNYFSFGDKIEEVRTERLPEYLLDFFGTLPAYNNLYIEGVQYQVFQDSVDPLYENDDPNFGSLILEVVKREQKLKQVKCVAAEKSCTPTPSCWDWNVNPPIEWLDDECIELNN